MQNESAMQETPYTIPKDWKWVLQEEVCSLTDGEKIEDETLPYLEVKYLRGTKEAEFVDKGKFIKNGSKVILVDGENSGEVFSVFEDGYMGSTFKQLIISKDVNEKYIQFFIDSKKQVYRNNKKGSAIPHLNKSLFFSMPLPLPPIAEQERIVGRIEKLFADLDAAKEKVQTVLEQSAERKAAILHQAFTGTLTTAWRKKNGITMDSWQEKTLGECGKWFGGGTPNTAMNDYWQDGTIMWITSKDMKTDEIEKTKLYVTDLGIQNSSAIYCEKSALLFVMRSGILRHLFPVAIVRKPFCVNQDLKVLIPENINIRFLFFYCKELETEILFNCKKDGTTVESIDFLRLKSTLLSLPTLPEQSEIVSLLDSLLGAEKTIAENCQTVLDKIGDIKKAILAKAFRGLL